MARETCRVTNFTPLCVTSSLGRGEFPVITYQAIALTACLKAQQHQTGGPGR
ncbi:MAG TPA: hypothetical protein VNY05_33095 [Candidatus Acidoferrales bacterium]|nr:hypothetical protein [Candidatus Acidoferrales bacterium]